MLAVKLLLLLCELLDPLRVILHSGQLGVGVDGQLGQLHGLLELAADGNLGLLHGGSLGSSIGCLMGCLICSHVTAFTWVLSLLMMITSQLPTQGYALPHHGEHNVRLLDDRNLAHLHGDLG